MFHPHEFAAPPDDRYRRQLDAGFARLRFEPAIEAEYHRSLLDTERASAIVCIIAAACVWFAFALLDIRRVLTLSPDAIDTEVAVWLAARGLVLAGLVAAPLILRRWRGDYGWISWTLYVAMGLTIALIAYIVHRKDLFAADSAQVIMVMAVFLPLGLTFRRALAAALLVTLVSVIVLLLFDARHELAHRIQLAAMLVMAVPIAAMGGYLRAHSQRRQFLLTAILDCQAHTDPLTGLPNRRSLFAHADKVVELAARDGCGVALAILDIDHFKQFNDHYGHGEGDAALCRVAETLAAASTFPLDMTARLGGEEFCVLLYGVSRGDAQARLEQLAARIRRLAIAHAGSPTGVVTLSGGAAMLGDGERFDPLVGRADAALYRAKREGRDRIDWA